METKLVRVPFNIDMAKEITNGEIEGKIVTRDGRNARIACWNYKSLSGEYPLLVLIENGIFEAQELYTLNGKEKSFIKEACDSDLVLEIPEYMMFKDGDVLTYRPNGDRLCIFIYKGNDIGLMHNYVTYDCDSRGNNIITFGKSSYISTLCELSTESEKQKLIEALKESKEPKAKEYLKRFFGIENSPILSNSSKIGKNFELKPFDKVLVRDTKDEKWKPAFFWCKTDFFRTIGFNDWTYCIPYEGNEHLLDTTNDYKEE